MARPFHKLRCVLHNNDVPHAELAQTLGISERGLSRRFMGIAPWRLDEMYTIMTMFDIPPQKMHEYFPEGGHNEGRLKGA